MRDVISSYTGKPKRSFRKLAIILVIILLMIMLIVLIFNRSWIQDGFTKSGQFLIMSFENVGNVNDKYFSIDVNASIDTSCNFKTEIENDDHSCGTMPVENSIIIVDCDIVAPKQKITINCDIIDDMIFNMTMSSRYQFIKRNYHCTNSECIEDKTIYTGPVPQFFSYFAFYWGDRLIDFTNWIQK